MISKWLNCLKKKINSNKAMLSLASSGLPFVVWIIILFGDFHLAYIRSKLLVRLNPFSYGLTAMSVLLVLFAVVRGWIPKKIINFLMLNIFSIFWTSFLAFSIWNYWVGDWRDGGFFFSFFLVFFSMHLVFWAIIFKSELERIAGTSHNNRK